MRAAAVVVVGLTSLVFATTASARVDRISITSREPFTTTKIGPYIKITGTLVGSIEVAEPIPNLARAARRPDGRVEYTSEFIIVAPASATAGNRVLLFDVENNGRPVAHGLYNSPSDAVVSQFEVGNAFLEDHGYTIAVVHWQAGKGIVLPEVAGADGKPVPIRAVGFVAIRDFAEFLRFESHDRFGTPNPLAGTIDHAIAVGSSQTGRWLKSFVHDGFNQAGPRPVFDGFHIHLGQSGSMPFIPPARVSDETIALTLTGDSSAYPFTYSEVLEPLAGRHEPAPKIIATNVEGDYFRRRLSLVRTGGSGTAEQTLPPSVRLWDIAGGSHGIIMSQNCDMPRSNLDWHPVLRAALVRLTRWAVANELPPPTQVVHVVPAEPAPYLMPAPTTDYPKATVMVPTRDADGNSSGGIRLPAVAVPTQTWGGWNAPLDTDCGDMSGFAYPFARTRLQRIMTGDARPSLEERYHDAADYMKRFTEAAEARVSEGYLLEADARDMIERARIASRLIPPSVVPPPR